MQTDDRFQKVNSIILNNEQFLVATGGESFDSVAAASGLALMLKSLGKNVVLYSPRAIKPSDFAPLTGLEEFTQKIEGRSDKLLITFDCPLDAIEKVSSNDEGEKLNLVVEFKEGAKTIDPSRVRVKQANPSFVAGFVVNCRLPNEEELIKKGQWILLSREGLPRPWAQVNLIEKKATLSESTASMLSRTNLKIPADAADNLYLGVKNGTKNFESADSIALETAAYCLRIKEDLERESTQVGKEKKTTPITEVEAKESSTPSEWQKPPIFTGATTPKV